MVSKLIIMVSYFLYANTCKTIEDYIWAYYFLMLKII